MSNSYLLQWSRVQHYLHHPMAPARDAQEQQRSLTTRSVIFSALLDFAGLALYSEHVSKTEVGVAKISFVKVISNTLR